VADAVERQQAVLHRVLDEIVALQPAPRDGAKEGKDRLEEAPIGHAVAALGRLQQRFPALWICSLAAARQFVLSAGSCNLKARAAEIEASAEDRGMNSRMSKRSFLGGVGAAAVAAVGVAIAGRGSEASAEVFEVNLTPDQWRRRLAPEQYRVLRQQATERSGTSPLNREHRRGTFLCAGCDLPVYRSQDKFESGTGWPSFTRPIAGSVRTRADRTLIFARTEVHCRRCGGHLGHVFDDGPPPTGQRWCMNGVALKFVPASA
jgi:peptide-methionine (R)-S-oxide reductase